MRKFIKMIISIVRGRTVVKKDYSKFLGKIVYLGEKFQKAAAVLDTWMMDDTIINKENNPKIISDILNKEFTFIKLEHMIDNKYYVVIGQGYMNLVRGYMILEGRE
jgi:hypothetical protein